MVLRVPGCEDMNLEADASYMAEVMNLAWAQHEYVSDAMGEVLDFFRDQKS